MIADYVNRWQKLQIIDIEIGNKIFISPGRNVCKWLGIKKVFSYSFIENETFVD